MKALYKDGVIVPDKPLKDITDNEVIEIKVLSGRTLEHLKQAHAITRFLYDNWREYGINTYKNIHEFRSFLSIELGYTKITATIIGKKLEPIIVPETWSYNIDQNSFIKKLYNPLMDFACEYMSMDRAELFRASQEHEFNSNKRTEIV